MLGLGGLLEKKNPLQFSFSNVTNVNTGTVQTASTTPTGYDSSVVANVTTGGGSIRKNSTGSYGTSIVLFPNDILNVQMTSDSIWGSTLTTTIKIGTVSTVWSVTTTSVTPGSWSNTIPGSSILSLPIYNTLSVTVKAAGGGGNGSNDTDNPNPKNPAFIHNDYGSDGANGTSSSFGAVMSATGGKGGTNDTGFGANGANGIGSGGNITNDSAGASGGTPSGFVPGSGGSGGRSISTYTYPTIAVGNITVIVGQGGLGGAGGLGGDTGNPVIAGGPGANGSVSASWS